MVLEFLGCCRCWMVVKFRDFRACRWSWGDDWDRELERRLFRRDISVDIDEGLRLRLELGATKDFESCWCRDDVDWE